jgi:uncharacterized protein
LITFDPAKDAANRRKHGVSLGVFEQMVGRLYLVDEAHSTATELRMHVIGRIGEGVYVAVMTPREDDERVISLRRASRRERKRYEEATSRW